MAIRFIIDSAADILPAQAKELGIIHLPLKVMFGEDEYYDAVTLSHKEFYEKLAKSDTLPTTSQIPPAEWADAYEKVAADGDTAIAITLSSKLSGTYQSAKLAAEDFPGKVFVVDSENVCIGQRILVLRGLELLNEGLCAEEIAAKLDEEKHNIKLFALLDTLEYLKKGGRISATTAFAGELLSIKPIICVDEGAVAMAGKARGTKQSSRLLREMIESSGGIDFDRPYCLAYSGLTDDGVRRFIDLTADMWNADAKDVPVASVGCTIGTHVGAGAVAAAYFVK